MMRAVPRLAAVVLLACGIAEAARVSGQAVDAAKLPADYVASDFVTLNDNGAWSWFMDERAIVDRGKLIVGSVRAIGTYDNGEADPNWGNLEIATLDLASKQIGKVVFHQHYEQDDHDDPAFYVRPDGRYLAVYTKHGVDRMVNYRVSESGDPLVWGPVKSFETPKRDPASDGAADSVTYSNLFGFPDGALYNFHRGADHDPNYLVSRDEGDTWEYGGRVMHGRDGYSPYLKYAYDGAGTLHFVATEDHPREFDNSLYHGYLKGGVLHHSNGRTVADLSRSTETAVRSWDFTQVFAADPDHVAWMCDIELDDQRRPYVAFSVQVDGRGLPRGRGGFDLRYYYARFDGQKWSWHEAAYAGQRLYRFEDDYTGLAALDPQDPNVMFISTNAEPTTGEPLVSAADNLRHFELFRGTTADGGATWAWTPITANSTTDNLRPIVPKWDDDRRALVWMRGAYHANHGEWTTKVVATILDGDEAAKAAK